MRPIGSRLSIHATTRSTPASAPAVHGPGTGRSRASTRKTYRPFNGWLGQYGTWRTFGTVYVVPRKVQLRLDPCATRVPFRILLGVINGKQPECHGCARTSSYRTTAISGVPPGAS